MYGRLLSIFCARRRKRFRGRDVLGVVDDKGKELEKGTEKEKREKKRKGELKMGRVFVVFFFVFLVLSILPSTYQRNLSPKRQFDHQQKQQQQQQQQQGFFDPHNHYDGIFPWETYVNLSAYANNEPFTYNQALNLYLFLNESFYPTGETIPAYNTGWVLFCFVSCILGFSFSFLCCFNSVWDFVLCKVFADVSNQQPTTKSPKQ